MLCPPRWRRATYRLAQREGSLNSTGGTFITGIASSRIRIAAPSDAARGAFRRHAMALTSLRYVDQWWQVIRTRAIWSVGSVGLSVV